MQLRNRLSLLVAIFDSKIYFISTVLYRQNYVRMTCVLVLSESLERVVV